MSDVYRQASAKQKWAEKHIDKLETLLSEWRKVDPCTLSIKQDAKTGDITYCVDHVPSLPDEIPFIIGDVLHNLRCALDYIACGMVVAGGGKVDSRTKFPIRQTAPDWEKAVLTLVKGANKLAVEELRYVQPYERGNLFLYMLHRLNNVDKHRLLLTVSLINTGRAVRPDEKATQIEGAENGFVADTPQGQVRLSARTAPPVALHTGQELLTVGAAQAEQQVGFFMGVTISEPGLTESTDVLLLLKLISGEVGLVVNSMARYV